MDKKIIKGLIDEKLEVIQEQFSIIKDYEAKIPIIELDLFMASIRDLYELVLNLQVENLGSAILRSKPEPEPEKVEVKEPESNSRPAENEPELEKPAAGSRFTSGIISMEPVIEDEPPPPPPPPPAPVPDNPPSPEAHVEEASQEQAHHQEKQQQRLTVDLFSDGAGSTLADRLKDGQEKRIADKLQENKAPDLRTTIGINDKFLFINELFEGNMRAYDDAVLQLNSSSTVAQADLLLLDLKIAYNWDSESLTVKKFVELVRRKF